MQSKSPLSKHIMRRIYISYALSYTEQPMLYYGLGLGAAVVLFGQLTHVAKLAQSLLATPVGQVPQFVELTFASAIARGELGDGTCRPRNGEFVGGGGVSVVASTVDAVTDANDVSLIGN